MGRIIDTIEDLIITATRHAVSDDMPDYCDLRTVVQLTESDRNYRPEMNAPYIGVTHNGDYCSVFEAQGAFCEMDEDSEKEQPFSFDGFIDRVTTGMTTDFRNPGHKISMVYENDPSLGGDELRRLMQHQYRSINRTGVRIGDLLDEKIEKLTPWVSRERSWLACWTGRNTMGKHELKSEIKRVTELSRKVPEARYGQNPLLSEFSGLKIRHDAFLDMLELAMKDSGNGLMMQLVDFHRVGNEIRRQLDRRGTDAEWKPVLPGDPIRPHGRSGPHDASSLLPPWLNFQIMNADPQSADNLVFINGVWHGMLSVTMGPQQVMTFNQLKKRIPRSIPYRIRYDIMPGGMNTLSLKKFMLDFSAFIPSFRPIWSSIEQLSKIDTTEPVCVMTIMASTWGESKETVRQNLTLLQKAFQGWGICDVTTTFGNPYRALTATMLAAQTGSGPDLLFPPLSDALSMLPLCRPASPWPDNASMLYPTPDGKIFPVGLATSLQNKHTEVVAGEPGSGKSLLVNMMNDAMVSTAQQALPYLAIVDKGYSAQGHIQLIRDSLPEERKNEAIGIVLRNHPDHCRNLFDIQFGAMMPITPELEWIKTILFAMCIDPEKGLPPNSKDTAGLLEDLVLLAFKDKAEGNPRKYEDSDPRINNPLIESGLWEKYTPEVWKSISMYHVRDLLFEAGYVQAAQVAQFKAVPELNDLQSYINHPSITSMYGSVYRDGGQEKLIDYVARCLTQACSEYKMLATHTKYVINPETRIIAIDLNNVVGDKTKAGQLRTGIMYLFAGQISGGDFVLPQYRDEVMRTVAPMYQAIHQKRLDQLDQEVKTKLYDELHNARDIPFIFEGLETQDREQRKFGIRTVLCSQYLTDFPESILSSANSLYLMQCRPQDIPLLKEHFDVPEVTIRRFMQIPKGPAPDGSGTSLLAVFRTKPGRIAQILKNTAGAKELWALNSSPADTALRKKLYEVVDGPTARNVLAEAFPHGSASKYIELRQRNAGEQDHSNITSQLSKELISKRGYNI